MSFPSVHIGTLEELVRHALDESTPVVLEGSDSQEEHSLLLRLEQINTSVVSNLTRCIALAFNGTASSFSDELIAAATEKNDAAAAAYVSRFEEGADEVRTTSLMQIGRARHRLTLVLRLLASLHETEDSHDIRPLLRKDFRIEFSAAAEDF